MSFEERGAGGSEDGEPGGDGGVEEIRRVDEEIESKVRRWIRRGTHLLAPTAVVYQWRHIFVVLFPALDDLWT